MQRSFQNRISFHLLAAKSHGYSKSDIFFSICLGLNVSIPTGTRVDYNKLKINKEKLRENFHVYPNQTGVFKHRLGITPLVWKLGAISSPPFYPALENNLEIAVFHTSLPANTRRPPDVRKVPFCSPA